MADYQLEFTGIKITELLNTVEDHKTSKLNTVGGSAKQLYIETADIAQGDGGVYSDNAVINYAAVKKYLSDSVAISGGTIRILNASITPISAESMTAKGDIFVASTPGRADVLHIGTNGQVLKVSGEGLPAWVNDTKLSMVDAGFVSNPTSAIVGISVNDHAITFQKGNFLTKHQDISGKLDNSYYSAKGALVVGAGKSGRVETLKIGADGKILRAVNGAPFWSDETVLSLELDSGASIGNAITGIAVRDHKVTVSKGDFLPLAKSGDQVQYRLDEQTHTLYINSVE